jgi:hypothetical protein
MPAGGRLLAGAAALVLLTADAAGSATSPRLQQLVELDTRVAARAAPDPGAREVALVPARAPLTRTRGPADTPAGQIARTRWVPRQHQ